jgi:hypothetical protein
LPKLSLKTLVKQKFEIQASFFENFFKALSAADRQLDRRFKRAGNDPEYVNSLENEASEFNAFIGEASQLLLVALYHWVERELKAVLGHCDPAAARRRPDLKAIGVALATLGVHLEQIPSYTDIDLLRHFANSWKHDPLWASAKLLNALGLDQKDQLRLSDLEVEAALRRAVALGDDADERELILAFCNRALDFLWAVADAAPLEFRSH